MARHHAHQDPLPGAPWRLGPRDLFELDPPPKTEGKAGIGWSAKAAPPAVIAPQSRKSLSEIVFCKFGQQAVSNLTAGVNSVSQRNPLAPQWDSRPRPAKRQHHGCIGCEKRPCWICLVFGLQVSSVKTLRRS